MRIVVVGGGIGGLAAALDLAAQGHDVAVLDRGERVGGKLATVGVAGREIDCGPTVLTMSEVLRDLFRATGADLADYLELVPLDRIARHRWSDGTTLDLFTDDERTRRAIADVFGVAEAARWVAFRRDARSLYEATRDSFIHAPKPSLTSLVLGASLKTAATLAKSNAKTMWSDLVDRFREPKLRQLFGRYATYAGGSPWEASATMHVIAHVEAVGVHRVAGGMVNIARAAERRLREIGAEIRTSTGVERLEISGRRVTAVVTATGERLTCEAVVMNADVAAIARGSFGDDAARAVAAPFSAAERSLSAVTIAAVAETSGFDLGHHNVFFSDDYEAEFVDVVDRRRAPADPTVYVCAEDRSDDGAPVGPERLFTIVNAPASGDEPAAWTLEERKRCEESTWRTLKRCGLEVKTLASVTSTPVEHGLRFPMTGGALYGRRPIGMMAALERSGSRTKVSGLYLAGGSVHPGAGVPMATLSGRLAARAVIEDLGSTRRSRTTAISGTTST